MSELGVAAQESERIDEDLSDTVRLFGGRVAKRVIRSLLRSGR